MDTYNSLTNSVLEFMKENQFCPSLIQVYKRCFAKLGYYLEENNISYSPEIALQWFEQKNNLSLSDKALGRMAFLRLRDMYETGFVRIEHAAGRIPVNSTLSEELLHSLEEYQDYLMTSVTENTVYTHRCTCLKFLRFAHEHGAKCISDISAQMILEFYTDPVYISNSSLLNYTVPSLMTYFFRKGEVMYSSTIILHYLTHGKKLGCFWNDVSRDDHEKIKSIIKTSDTVDTDVLRGYKEALVKLYQDNGYSKGAVSVNNRTIDLLILFLEMNGYSYNPEIATVWFEAVRRYFGKKTDSYRRALGMTAEYHASSEFTLTAIYREKTSRFCQLPDWCRKAAVPYVEMKIKEGWERSTLDMIRSCITRFCVYLDQEGLRSFADLNAEHIKKFNVYDQHKTPQGKNAYNVRIRKFLIYLGEQNYLSNPMLFVALPCTSAPKETIVVVLSEAEMSELKEQLETEDSRLSLRKKAMLLLGLKMGLRSSDVVNLSIHDINWHTASIRFVQKKTSVEVNLPMPAEVGNALYRYITEERGQKAVPEIFLSEKAPRNPVGRAVCNKALNTALPDRDVEGSGFHVMRKTYATSLLKNGVGAGMVAEALGQRGTSSVHCYLSLDTERMRMCPLALSECGIGGWNHGE